MSENTPEDSPLSSSNKLENSPVTYGINVDQHKKATEEDTGQPAPLNDVSATDKHSVETKPDVGLVIAEAIAPVTHDNNVGNQPLQTIEVVGQAIAEPSAPVTNDKVDNRTQETIEVLEQAVPETSDRNVDKTNHDKTEDAVQMQTSDIKTLTKHNEIFTADIESQRALALEIETVKEDLYYKDQDYKKEKIKVEHRQQRNKILRTKNEKLKEEINDIKQRETDLQQSFKAKEVGFKEEISRLQQMFQESEENLKTFKQMFQASEENLTRLREKQVQLEVRNNQLVEENIRCETNNISLAEENNKHIEKITSLNAKLQQLESKVSCIPVLQKDIKDKEQLYTQAQEQHYYEKEEMVKQWNDYVVKLIKDHETVVKKLQKELVDVKKKVTNLTEEKKTLKATLDKKDEESKKHIASAKNAFKQLDDARKDFEARKSNFEKQIQTLQGEKHKSDNLASERQNNISQKEREICQYQYHIQQMQTALNNHTTAINSLEKDKKDLTLRLSKLAGANLTYNNPNIADLSDENRPTKLAEEFSELYDNEWTDAFEVVEKENEREKTQFMLNILKRVSHLCHDTSRNHMEAVKKSLSTLVILDLWEEEEEPVEEVIMIEAALQGDATITDKMDARGEQALPSQNDERNIKTLQVTVAANGDKSVNPSTSKTHGISEVDTREHKVNRKSGDDSDSNAVGANENGDGNIFDNMNDDQNKHQNGHQDPSPEITDQSKTNAEVPGISGSQTSPESKSADDMNQEVKKEKQENQVSCNILTQNNEEEITQSIKEEKTLSKEEEKSQRKEELKVQSIEEEKNRSKEEEKLRGIEEEFTQNIEELKPQRKEEDKIQSKEEEKSQSKAEQKPQNKEEEKPESKAEEKTQSKEEEKTQIKEKKKPHIKAEENNQSIEEQETRRKEEENPQNMEEEKILSEVEEKPQSMEEKKIQRMEVENTDQNRTNVKDSLTNGNQASHETNRTNVNNTADHADGENCGQKTENNSVGASSTAEFDANKDMTEQIEYVFERKDEHESSHPESEKADKDIHPNGDNGVENEISKPPDDNENKSKDFQKSESTKRCSRKTQTYFKTLSANFDQLANEQKKAILDIRKLFENQMSNDFHKTGQDILAKEIGKEKQPDEFIDIYIAKCMKICWSMCRHEPPVHIHFPEIEGDLPYDTNMYKPYTKAGKHLDFVVWPALYLHENGPMLAKGVAQGRQ